MHRLAARCVLSFAVSLSLLSAALRAVEEAPRAGQNEDGYCRFVKTASPDGRYILGWAPEGTKPEDLSKLKEWAEDVKEPNSDIEPVNFLMEARTRKILTVIPNFSHFAGQGMRKNRHDLFTAWSADSKRALAVYEGRWEDDDIVWIETDPVKVTSVYEQMCKPYRTLLRAKEKEQGNVAIMFTEPAIMPGNELVVDAHALIPKEGPYYHYRLRYRVEGKGAKVRMVLQQSRKIPEGEERTTGVDFEPDLNAAYQKLRTKLSPKDFAKLKAEQLAWLKWRDTVPEEARQNATAQRAAYLRALSEQ